MRACARKGHVTYRPDETELAERLTARTAVGASWRCLRCGDFVLGEPALSATKHRRLDEVAHLRQRIDLIVQPA